MSPEGQTATEEPDAPVDPVDPVDAEPAESTESAAAAAERERLEAEIQERRERALAQVVKFGEPVLRSAASKVTEFDGKLAEEIERMGQIMHGAMGVGLAATQVGTLRRVLVYKAGPDASLVALVNPHLAWSSKDLVTAEEGCLSLPKVIVEVERPMHVTVKAQDATGEQILIEAAGLEARVIQHEMDHLDGTLILDRTVRSQRKGALRALREGTSYLPPSLEDEAEAGDGAGVAEPGPTA